MSLATWLDWALKYKYGQASDAFLKIAFISNAGQGLALALEDAAVLGWHLKRQGLTQRALRRYVPFALRSCSLENLCKRATCHLLHAWQASAQQHG